MTQPHPAGQPTGPTEEHLDPERVVIRDKRRIDPVTGAARVSEPAPPGPAGDPPAPGPAPGGAIDARVAELTEDLQRLKAEFDNYRRRVDRDRAAWSDQATAALLTSLLPVLDDIDRARAHGDLTGAFGAVGEALVALAGRWKLERYGEPGEAFDPTVHEALMQVPSAQATEPVTTDVVRSGYRFAGRVLRPAQVAVAMPAAAPEPAPNEPVEDNEALEPTESTGPTEPQ